MPGWLAKPLGQVSAIKPPKAEARAKLADGDPVSFAPMEDLGIGEKYMRPSRTRRLDEVSASYTYFAEGDVLLAKITPCFENGKLGVARGLTNGVGFGSSEYIVLRPGPTLDAEFLYYYLARPTFLEEGARTMTGAVGHKRVTKEFVESYSIPLPPLPEQRRIVAILDEVFEGIATAKAHAEKNLQNARELADARSEDLMAAVCADCAEQPLESVSKIVNGFAFKSTDFSDKEVVRCIKITNVGAGEFVADESGCLPADFASRYRTFAATEGSIVIALTRTIIAAGLKAAVVPASYDQALVNQRVATITVDTQRVTRDFLFAYLRTGRVLRYVQACVNTLMQPNLSILDLRRLPLPMPTVVAQQRFNESCSLLDAHMESLMSVYHQKVAALDELKRSLLHQAFTGQLSRAIPLGSHQAAT